MSYVSIKSVMVISIAALFICICGLGMVFYNQVAPAQKHVPLNQVPTKPTASSKNQVANHLLALGDSLTRGTGDATGEGYIGDLMKSLKTKNPLTLTNLAINGETSAGLLKQLQQPEVTRQIQQATVIIFTVGGDDLFNGGQNLAHFSKQTIQHDETMYLHNLNLIYQHIRQENPTASIFHIGLYNPFNSYKNGATTSSVVRKWNDDSAEVAAKYKDVIEVPIYDLFQRHVQNYLSSDDFHPNTLGYQRIANRLLPLITF